MKAITSTIIAIALTLAVGIAIGESGIGAGERYTAPDAQVQGYANTTVNDLLRM